MEDIIIRGLLADSTVKIMAISGKALVEQARETHGLSRVCTAALGRTLMMTSMMGAQLKNADEIWQIINSTQFSYMQDRNVRTRRQMREQFRSMQRHHMFFTTVPMPRQGLVFRQKEIFTAG